MALRRTKGSKDEEEAAAVAELKRVDVDSDQEEYCQYS